MEDRYIFKFGKHKGRSIDSVPNSYLDFVVNNFDEDEEWKADALVACEQELDWRKKHDVYIGEET